MPDDLTPADPDDLRQSIGYALRFGQGGKPHRVAGDDMARLAADIIAGHLERSGFVMMKKPPAPAAPIGYSRKIPLKP